MSRPASGITIPVSGAILSTDAPSSGGVYERLPYCAKVSETVTVPAGGGLQGGVRGAGAGRAAAPTRAEVGRQGRPLLEAVPEGLSREGRENEGCFAWLQGRKL